MMQRAHVALTPGRDFGPATAERRVRLSFASSMAQLEAAVVRLGRELQSPRSNPGLGGLAGGR